MKKFDPELLDPKEIWNSLTYEQQVGATAHIFSVLKEQAMRGGTYRYLIYNRLGFKEDAYCVLLDGLDINNNLSWYPMNKNGKTRNNKMGKR